MKQNGRGQMNLERGQLLRRAVGMASKMAGRQKTARRTSTAGGHSQRILRPAQASKQTATDGRPRSKQQQLQTMSAACRAGKWGECRDTGNHEGGLRPTYFCPYPTYRLCLSLSLPTPLICKTQFSPKLTFFFVFLFLSLYSHYKFRPLTPSIVLFGYPNLSPNLLPTPTFPSQRGTREG